MLQPLSPSTVKMKGEVIKWIRSKIDYSKEKEGKPYFFQGTVSFSDCQLPSLGCVSESIRHHYIRNVLDESMKSYLEKSTSLNKLSQAMKLHAINVPRDGNCLLHAVSVAVWAVEDNGDTLLKLMFMSVKTDLNFQKRWRSQKMRQLQLRDKSDSKIISNEWDNIMYTLSNTESRDVSATVPSVFSDSFYIYVLANILRRPIIIATENLTTSVLRSNTQNDHIGGIYLPLEWLPIECCKTPVIIGFNSNHFYPLISETCQHSTSQQQGEDDPWIFPLVNSDFSFLCIRYLLEEEVPKAWDMVQSFLLVKEFDVMGDDGHLIKVPCAKMNLKPLESKYNPLFQHLDFIKETVGASSGNLYPVLLLAQQNHYPFYHAEVSNQTEVVPSVFVNGATDNLKYAMEDGKARSLCVERKNQNSTLQHISEDCIQHGNPSSENLLKLKQLSIKDAEYPLTPTAPLPSLEPYSCDQMPPMVAENLRNQRDFRFYQAYPDCSEYHQAEVETTGTTLSSNRDPAVYPTAPLLSLEPQSNSQMLSMMADRCIQQCGYRCSNQTYPFCHECYQAEILKNKHQEHNYTTAPSSPQNFETKFRDLGTILSGTKDKLDEASMNMATVNPSASSLTLSSTGLFSKSQDHSGSGNSWLQQNEHRVHISPSLTDNYETDLEVNNTDHNSKNFEQKMLFHNISPEGSNKIRSYATFHKEMVSSDTEAKNGCIESQCKESINAETVNSFIRDTEVKMEAIHKTKCANIYCSNSISGSELLCRVCQNILKNGCQQHEEPLEKTREVATKSVSQYETEKELHKTNSVEVSAGKNIQSQHEVYKKPDSCTQNLSSFMKPWKSSCGSNIYQASDEVPYMVSLLQMYPDPDIEIDSASTSYKLNPITQIQATSKSVKKHVSPTFSAATSEKSLCKDINHPVFSSLNEDVNYAHKLYKNVPLDAKCKERTKSTLDETYNSIVQPKQLSPYISSVHLISTQENEVPLSSDSNSSPSDLPYVGLYSESQQSFQPFESTSSSEYSLSTFSALSNPELNSALVTSMTRHNNYGSRHQLSTCSFDSFNQNAKHNFVPKLQEVKEKWNTSGVKCKLGTCSNYSNPEKKGYCNACYEVIRRQKIIEWEAQRGVDVPD